MKTNIFSSKKVLLYSFTGFLSLLMVSCGSYQNSSYYESDGIYGNTETRNTENYKPVASNNYYKEYFRSLQNENQPTEIFTNVDDYNIYNDSIYDGNPETNYTYGSWGSNHTDTSINIYPNNWGLSMGFGLGYPYYGWGYSNFGWGYPYYYGFSSWGWNYPYYGYGWVFPNYYYGWNYPYYGYNYRYYNNRHYSYGASRRGSEYYSNTPSSRNYSTDRTYTNRNSNYTNSRTSTNRQASPTFTRRSQFQNNSSSTQSRTYTNSRQSSSNDSYSTQSRSYSSPSSSGRSYSPGSSSGGGSSSNSSSGGGRSSGGSRR